MTDHFQEIYVSKAAQYDALVTREDYEGNILKALSGICSIAGSRVVEFGAGTGRLTRLLSPLVKSIQAFDASQHMLDVAESTLKTLGTSNWTLGVADNRNVPVEDSSADIAIEGWSFGHFSGWYPDSWRDEAGKALQEMTRVLRSGGTAILLETLGTGRETPEPPHEGLANLYAWWETEHGFSQQWIRTDYNFASVQEAETLTRFFFGDELADKVAQQGKTILPECTGIWWKVVRK